MIKFKYYKSGTTFAAATDIAADDIVFVEDGNKIHTHDHDFVFGNAYADLISANTTAIQENATAIGTKQANVPKLGSTTKPVYTSAAGTFAACSTYAGGTAVTLNGSNKGGSTASFYAPTGAGTSGQVLTSAGSGAPTWTTLAIPTVPSGFDSNTTLVNSFGSKTGAITVKGGQTANGSVNLAMSDNELQASIVGLGSAAYTASTAYATAAQGTKADNAMPKSGGTFTGAITLSGAPTSNLHAATKKYVDDAVSGLSGAMHFIGTTTTALTDGATTATLAGSGLSKTTGFVAGDVVLNGDKEFVWNGSKWEVLGDEGSYALKTTTATGTGALTGGGAISSNQTIDMIEIGDAASAGPSANVSGANAISVPSISIDKYGRVTALSSKTYTGVAAAANGTFSVKTKVGSTATTAADFTAN